ncbi:MAG: PQQ-dependent sugar dehydrogenase [Flavobacterium sp.]|jgi:glucose/arabinose dehydrogenase|uniref:PQQ-dependent sugar dehydrogenase n=1 Tax=Flavobacterium sp. TaxID=239 RepID=UPI003BA50DA0
MKRLLQFCVVLLTTISFAQTISLQTFATGFSSPVAIVNAGDSRLFVVQRGGAIRILNANGTINATNFLTLTSSTIVSGGERGLLGLAFHPNYATNGYFYVNYTRASDGATVIARYSVSANPDVADASSAQVLLTIAQPFNNHNGGSLVFGPDGYLYIGMGDGGSGGDPDNYGQNINSLLGKMLRIDVDSGSPYAIPAGNPYAGATPGADEIWAVGMRNPWKFSFDKQTGDLWIADVGQNAREEINKAASTAAGLNYGWRCYEANIPYNTNGCQSASNYFMPVANYALGNGNCSITGGYVYRGSTYPNMVGKYFFADYCSNRIGWVENNGGTITWSSLFTGNFVSFGEDINGELYVAGISNGTISKIIDTSLGTEVFQRNGLSLYPNPAQHSVTLQNTSLLNLTQLSVFDMMGKKVLHKSMNTAESTEISIAQLSSGLYVVSVEEANGNTFTSKLMVK